MNRRFWIATAVGGVIGAAVVATFGPYVRSEVQARAERYGARVVVQHVAPSVQGIRLQGVAITLAEVPGMKVHLDEVLVGWRAPRRLRATGGRLAARGPLGDLAKRLEAWRAKHLGSAKSESGLRTAARRIEIDGLELRWRYGQDDRRSLLANGVTLFRESKQLGIRAASVSARHDGMRAHLERPQVGFVRKNGEYRVSMLGAEALQLDMELRDAPVRPAGKGTPTKLVGPASKHVRAARRVHRSLMQLASWVDRWLEPGAMAKVAAAGATVRVGDDIIGFGPGELSVRRDAADLLVALVPGASKPGSSASPNAERSLTFSLRLPIAAHGGQATAERDVVAQLKGGPVWLSTLGITEGELGLQNVSRSSIKSDARVVLSHDGSRLALDGRGELNRITLASSRLAAEPLKDMNFSWRAKADISLDGRSVKLTEAELVLGEARLLLSGSYERTDAGRRVDMQFELPPISCQSLFSSIPAAMVPRLDGMRFVGTMSAKGHAKFDTADLSRGYDVDFGGERSCRVSDAPKSLDAARFKESFEKLVYDRRGKTETMSFGPGTDGWTPLSSISRFMIGAVLTTEDGRFFRHDGFDKEAIVNSLRENLRAGRFVRGASTISMQLAKNLYLPRTKTISRKLQEAILTMYLEQSLTKEEMMELYFNVIEYGPMLYGVQPAARHYFRSLPGALSLGQSLYLASILRAPKTQYFGKNQAVTPKHMAYLHRLMKIVHKIKRIDEDDLDLGLRETVVFGGPPHVAPPEDDPYDELEGLAGLAPAPADNDDVDDTATPKPDAKPPKAAVTAQPTGSIRPR